MSGLFLVLEGSEGAGKTTQRERIKHWFEDRGFKVTVTREPGGTPLAEQIRGLLLSQRDEVVDVDAELLLFFAARAQHVNTVIKPALARGEIVICDRFVDSTYAYQCWGRGIEYARIEALEMFTLGNFKPTCTFWFDLPLEIGVQRLIARGGSPDRFEGEGKDFFTKVSEGYRARAAMAPERYLRVDAAQSVQEVFEQIEPKLMELFLGTLTD